MAFSQEQYEAFNELNRRGALSEERKQAFTALRERGAFKEFEPAVVQKPEQIPDMETFLQDVPKYDETAPQTTDDMSVARIPGSTAIGESQGAKGLTLEAMPVIRPTLEAGASVGGAVIAAPTTPAGQAAAGALGYGIGKKAADIIEGWASPNVERQTPETFTGQLKQFGRDVATETIQSAEDVAFGATMEMGGQLAMAGISATAKFAMNKLRDIGKALPPITKAGATEKAKSILIAQTSDGPLYAQNMAEAEALEEAIPGLKFSRGQATNDPDIIKFERAQARSPGGAAQEQLEQAARNSKAIRDFMDEQKGLAGIEDVIDPLAKQEKSAATAAQAAAQKLEAEGAVLGGGMGAVESGEAIRTAARTGKTQAQKQAGELFKDVPEFPINAKNLISKIDELSQPLNKFEGVGKNIPEEFAQYKDVLKKTNGVVTPQDLQGLRSNLTDAMRDAQGSAMPNNRVVSRLSQLIGEVDTVLKEAGELTEKGELATYKGKVVNPQKLQRELTETTERLKKEGYVEAKEALTDAPIKGTIPKTGEPVSIRYSHNKEKTPYMGEEFAQDIEPAGKYFAPNSGKYKLPNNEYGVANFKNPIVLEHKTTRHGGWKTDLSNMYGGKTGKDLTNAIKKDGYDGIITLDGDRISESVIVNQSVTKSGLTEAKPDVKQIYAELQESGTPAIMRQVAEDTPDYVKRITKTYKDVFQKDPPMIAGKEKPIIKSLKETKAGLEKTIAGLEITEQEIKAEASTKLKTAQQFFKKEVIEKFKSGTTGDILKKGAQGDKISNAQIASRYFKPGSAGVEQATQFIDSVGNNPQAREAIEDYIKQDLLSTATNPVTGEIIESKLKTWLTRYKPSLKKLGLENKFNTIVKSSEELNKAKDMQVAFNKSVASKMINADVDTAVKTAFASGSKKKAAERLMFKLKGNKKAVSGLQNSIIDDIITGAETTKPDAFGNPVISYDKIEKAVKRYQPAIDVVFKDSPEKLKALSQFRSALSKMQRGIASPLGGGSDSFENIVTKMSKTSGLTHSRTVNIIKALAKPLLDMSDAQVNAILNRAAFDPEFAQTIMMAANGRSVKVIENRLKSHLAAIGLRQTNIYDKTSKGTQKVIDFFNTKDKN